MLVNRNDYTVHASLTFDPVWAGKKIVLGAVGGVIGSFIGQGIGSIFSKGCGTAQAGKTLRAAGSGDTEELIKRANYIRVCQETSKEKWGFRGMLIGAGVFAFPSEMVDGVSWVGGKLITASQAIKEWNGQGIHETAEKVATFSQEMTAAAVQKGTSIASPIVKGTCTQIGKEPSNLADHASKLASNGILQVN